jgi:hypothetical protein
MLPAFQRAFVWKYLYSFRLHIVGVRGFDAGGRAGSVAAQNIAAECKASFKCSSHNESGFPPYSLARKQGRI